MLKIKKKNKKVANSTVVIGQSALLRGSLVIALIAFTSAFLDDTVNLTDTSVYWYSLRVNLVDAKNNDWIPDSYVEIYGTDGSEYKIYTTKVDVVQVYLRSNVNYKVFAKCDRYMTQFVDIDVNIYSNKENEISFILEEAPTLNILSK